MKRSLLLFFSVTLIALSNRLYSQCTACSATTFDIDISASIDTMVSLQSPRSGDCCTGTNCIKFNLTVNPGCGYLNFTVANPAPPGNAAYYQIDCGPQTSLGTPICIVGRTTVCITFCKPGNDAPIYTITTGTAPNVSDDITLREGCTGSMSVSGLHVSTTNWTSVYPGVQGTYDSYLSCTAGCSSVNVTPQQSSPPYIDYQVSGTSLCGSAFIDTIRVYTIPPISIAITPNDASICAGQQGNVTLTATPSGGNSPYSFLWSTGQSTPSITVNSAGTYNVAITDANSCFPSVQSVTVGTTPLPPSPSVSSNSPVCNGSTLNLFASTVAGATYSWTGPNGFTSSSQNPVITNVAAADAGYYSVTVTVGQCSSISSGTTVTVNPIPAAPVVSGNSPVCAGADLNLTASAIAGASYSWTGPNGFSSLLQNPGIINIGMANSGTYNVTSTVNGCTSAASSIDILVHPLPPAPAVSGNSPLCAGGTISLTAGAINGASYFWTGPNGFTSATQNPTISNAGTNASGIYSVSATINGCTGPSGTVSVTVNPVPSSPLISSNSPLCTGSVINLAASSIAGATFSWQGPNGFASASQNPSINNSTTAASGTYSVTATVNGCTSAASNTVVTVNAIPASPVAGANSPLCEGSTLSLTASTIVGAVYSWSGPNGFISASQNPTIANINSIQSGVYSVTATANGCTSQSATQNVVVNMVPAPPAASSNSPLCAGSSLNLLATTVAGATYSWNGPNGFTSSAQNPVINYITSVNTGVYSVTATVGQCTSLSSATTVTVKPIPAAPTVSGNSPVCSGANLNLTASSVAGGSYNWTGPNGFTSMSQNPSITNVTAGQSGVYSVTITVNGCTSQSASLNAVVNMRPSSPTVSSNSPVCSGTSILLNASAIPGAVYSWTGPNGFTSTQQNPVITNAALTNAGTYGALVTVNGCSSSSASSIPVVVNQTPVAPIAVNNGPICVGSTLNLSASGGANFKWTGPNGVTSTLQNYSITNVTLANAGIYNVAATVNGCTGPAGSTSVIITAPATANAGIDRTVCAADLSIPLSGIISGGQGSGAWSSNGSGNFSPANTNLNCSYYPTPSDKSAGNVKLTLSTTGNGACPVSSSSIFITFATPPTANAGNDKTVCANNANITLSGQFKNAASAAWSTSGTGVFSPNNSNLNATYIPGERDKLIGRVTLTLTTAGNNSCTAASDALIVTIQPSPVINGGGVKYVTENNSIILSPVVSGSNLKYTWTPAIYLNSTTIPNPVCTPKTDVTYKLLVKDTAGCSSTADIMVKVLKRPEIPNVFTPNGDGINDRWQIKYLASYPDCQVDVYNRYGQIVYQSVGYINAWDGSSKGKQVPAGTYYYLINLKNNLSPLSGFVDIAR